jgi:hypothetical protein
MGTRKRSPLFSCLALAVLQLLAAPNFAQAQDKTTSDATTQKLPPPLTNKERWRLYLDETYLSPMPYVVSLGAGAVYQAIDYPSEWGGGFKGFGPRVASQFGLVVTQNSIHDGGEALMHYESRYVPSGETGFWRRTAYAVEMSFLTYDQRGHKQLDLAQIAGAYGSGVISTVWYPKRYTPLVQGIQTGHLQFGFVMGTNLYEEFSPQLQRLWPVRKFVGHAPEKAP